MAYFLISQKICFQPALMVQGAAVQNQQKETLIVKRVLQLFEWLISYLKDCLGLFYFLLLSSLISTLGFCDVTKRKFI